MSKRILTIIMALLSYTVHAQVALDSEGRDAEYVNSIKTRSEKIVQTLALDNKNVYENVLNIVCNRYFKLNDIYRDYPDKNVRDAELYKHHFEFEADLANYLSDTQIEQVKDGMTYGVVQKTYEAHLEMIPSLSEAEKRQILNWLKEAREFAIDAENSKAKHNWFGKYKGRINNWLSKRGYNLDEERKAWYKRIEEQKKNK
ncbi:MAG: DUF3826 domain-containing protein [Prevotella sp.]|nr:DUF3826 domain-containing protein [Prevotella sp.]